MQQLSTCTNCQQPLKEVVLEGHYGQSVSADVCGNCDTPLMLLDLPRLTLALLVRHGEALVVDEPILRGSFSTGYSDKPP